MTDLEMMELAAKAAGLDVHRGDKWQSDMLFRAVPRPNSPLVANVEWNPLADDGDALRLAVRLGLAVVPYPADIAALHNASGRSWAEMRGGDTYAAARRAIVRAAAALGAEKTPKPEISRRPPAGGRLD